MEILTENRIRFLKKQLATIYNQLDSDGLLKGTALDVSSPVTSSAEEIGDGRLLLETEISEILQKLPELSVKPATCIDNSASAILRDFLVLNGGPTGGWEEKDHLIFLQYYRRFKDSPEVLTERIHSVLSGKSVQDIQQHVAWFEKLNELQDAQKTELKEWKLRKSIEEERKKQEVSDSSDTSGEGHKQWVAAWRRQREIVLQKLHQWREENKEKQEKNKECSQETAKNNTGIKALNTADREYNVLLAYLKKNEKLATKRAAAQAAAFVTNLEKKEKADMFKGKMQLSHQRNIAHVLQRRQKIMATREDQIKVKPVINAKINVRRDPKRLLKPTAARIAKQLEEDSDQQFSSVQYILDIRHRAIPSWRQRMSASF